MDDIAESGSPQGVLARASIPEVEVHDIAQQPRVVVVDSVQDPGNIGAIVRTAAAAQFDAVVATKGSADLWSPRAIRASAGTIFALDVLGNAEMSSVLDLLLGNGHTIVAAGVDGPSELKQLRHTERMTLVVGSEAHGLTAVASQTASSYVRIPMGPNVESLNVAVAAGLIMYQMQDNSVGQ